MACGYFLPKCTEESTDVQLPCRETCMKAKQRCTSSMKSNGSKWPREFRCRNLRRKRQGGCISHVRESQSDGPLHVFCEENVMDMCANLTFQSGTLPNMFLQRDQQAIQREISQYLPLVRTQCSPYLRFFICGTYMPFCIQSETPFAMPCKQLCEEIYRDCFADYERTYVGIPWSSKFQCHRFPESNDPLRRCVTWTDSTESLLESNNNTAQVTADSADDTE